MNVTITAHAALPTDNRPCGGFAALVEIPDLNGPTALPVPPRDHLDQEHYTAEGGLPVTTPDEIRRHLASRTLSSLALFAKGPDAPKGTIHTGDHLTAIAFLEEIRRRNIRYIDVTSGGQPTPRADLCRRIADWHAQRADQRGTPHFAYATRQSTRDGIADPQA